MAKDIRFLEKNLLATIRAFATLEMQFEWASKAAQMIYARTKTGKGLSEDVRSLDKKGAPSLKELDKLSKPYIAYRLKNRGLLGSFAAPDRSNLTFKGELLEAVTANIVNGRAVVEIANVKHHSGMNMRKLADKVSIEGRPFFGLSSTESKIFESFIKRKLRDRIRSLTK